MYSACKANKKKPKNPNLTKYVYSVIINNAALVDDLRKKLQKNNIYLSQQWLSIYICIEDIHYPANY